MILAAHLDAASVLAMFGVMQILTALRYRIPMPVQPLKAMAALVIAQKLPGDTLYGAGLAIGIVMLLLTVTGLVDWVARIVPKAVVRGIQLGLGLQLGSIALKDYAGRDGDAGLDPGRHRFHTHDLPDGTKEGPHGHRPDRPGLCIRLRVPPRTFRIRQGRRPATAGLAGSLRDRRLDRLPHTGIAAVAPFACQLHSGDTPDRPGFLPAARHNSSPISLTYSAMNP